MAGRPIDEKIVAMKMDNSDLKRKAAETTGIFGKLQSSLSKVGTTNTFGKMTQELGNIRTAASNVDLSRIASATEQVASRFSNLGVVATTALVNITNRAVEAGLTLYKSLTMDPIMDGFREYELKMSSIQTILANTQSKGSDLSDVKRNFEQLNAYADKTIYSFADMTKNIGLFTNAGLELDESTSMIKGFSNAAAASGAGSEEAARAAYQLSQGLASGYLMQMDWMSLTNAGMGNDNMKRDLIALGKAMGTLDKGTEDTVKNWKEYLTDEKWLTSDVMSTYLQAMAGDMDKAKLMTKGLSEAQADLLLQNAKTGEDAATKVRTFTQMISGLREGIGSGWAETFELIFGDFEEATERWSALSEVLNGFFDKGTDARNSFIKGLADAGVFKAMFAVFTTTGATVLKIINAIGDGFKKAFGSVSIDGILKMATGLKDFALSLKPSEETLAKMSTIFQAFFSVIKMVVSVAIELGKALIDMIPPGLGTAALNLLKGFADMVIAFTESVIAGKEVSSTAGSMASVFGALGGAVGSIIKGFGKLGDAVSEAFSILATGDFTGKGPWSEDSQIVDWLFNIREGFQGLGSLFSGINFSPIANGFGAIGDAISSMSFSLDPVANAFQSFFDLIVTGYEWLKEKISGIGEAISNAMPSGDKLIAGGFIAGLVAVVAMVGKVIWDLFEVFTGWGKIGNGVTEVLESVGGALNAFSAQVYSQALLTIAIAIGVLAIGFKLLSTLNGAQIANGLYMIVGSLTALVGAMAIMNKFDITGQGFRTSVMLVGMAVAFAILSGALRKIADLSWGEITKGIIGLIGVLGAMSTALTLMGKFGGAKVGASALQMVALAGAVHIMLSAIQKIAKIDPGSLVKGMVVISVVLFQMAIFMRAVSGVKFGIGSTLGMLAVGQAIENMAGAIKKIAELDATSLIVGLTTITLILAQITLFTKMTSDAGLLSAGAGMLLMAGAISALVVPIGILGSMDISTLVKGLTSMGIALGIIGATSMLMTGMIAAGAGLILVAGALTLLLVPISAFAAMGWGPLLTGMAGLALSLGIIGGAAALLTPVIPVLVALGLGILALGAGMGLAGAGMALFATGLVTLAGLASGAVTTIVAVIGTLIVGLVSLIPTAVDFIVKLVLQIAQAIATYGPVVGTKIAELLLGLINVIIEYLPQFITKGTELITKFLEGMGQAVPAVITAAMGYMLDIVNGMADALNQNGTAIIAAFSRLMAEILIIMVTAGAQMVSAIFGWIPGVSEASSSLAKTAEAEIRENFNAQDVGNKKGSDFASALGSKSGAAQTAGSKIGNSGEAGAKTANLLTIGSEKGANFASALGAKAGAAQSSGSSLANAGKAGAGSVDMTATGGFFGQGFANGIGAAKDAVVGAAQRLAESAASTVKGWLNIQSPSRVAMGLGGYFGEGLAIGITDKVSTVANSAKNLALTAKDALNEFIQGFELPEQDNELHFKAVIDYDRLDASRFGGLAPMSIAPNSSLATRLYPTQSSSVSSSDLGQNGDNNAIIRRQEQQIGIMEKQIELLSQISNKDTSTYLDGKELYNNNKKIENDNTNIRNIFKGVTTI